MHGLHFVYANIMLMCASATSSDHLPFEFTHRQNHICVLKSRVLKKSPNSRTTCRGHSIEPEAEAEEAVSEAEAETETEAEAETERVKGRSRVVRDRDNK